MAGALSRDGGHRAGMHQYDALCGRDPGGETGLPVFSMVGFVNWFQSGLTPRHWPYSL